MKTIRNIFTRAACILTVAVLFTAFTSITVSALSFSLGYLENGDGTLYDEERGCYVDMDTYHCAYGYEYDKEYESYVYKTVTETYLCDCAACKYMKEGHAIVIPVNESENADADTNNDAEEALKQLFIEGKEVSEESISDNNWVYEKKTNTLSLDNYSYEGSGMFTVAGGNIDSAESEEDEDSDDDDDTDVEWEDEDFDSESDEEFSEETSDSNNESKSVKGVIQTNGDLTLKISGENHITVTDEGSDVSFAVNIGGELKIEGDGLLYVTTDTETKVYSGPKETSEPDNTGIIIMNDYDNNQVVNEAPIEQTVNEAPVTQNVQNGDVNVTNTNNNNVDIPEFCNRINLPGASNTISFNPTVKVSLPENNVERTVINGLQRSHPEVVKTASVSKPEAAPKTADPNTVGLLTALTATLIGGAAALVILVRRGMLRKL